ncbi:MAG TPA: glycosyltransferase family 4 protein [Rhodospirillales bacterium]|jgi:glycosyltransferase involved in cell wall biosynthesis|nr:glycosyltransferase family 4 protein [Rhodospirillales bacterium]
MKIAQVAPLMESVPPQQYGGTERVVSWITEELVRLGHDVTLFATGDSTTAAELVACSDRALRFDPEATFPIPYFFVMLDRVRRRAAEFDVIHFHTDYLHWPLFRDMAERTVTTLHGRLDLGFLKPAFAGFPEMPLVSISNDQRKPFPDANWRSTIYHGLPRDLLPYCEAPSRDYLAFVGRICPEKRVDRAIAIAKRAGMKLRIAAKIDKSDETYFAETIKPLLDDPLIEFVGEINDAQKPAFFGNALGVLFPIDWPEPFGLVMIESMSCGTPVIAYNHGSVPEVIDHGVTGFVVSGEDEAVVAVNRLTMLNRLMVRRRFEERFTVERMTADYVGLYEAAASGADRATASLRA